MVFRILFCLLSVLVFIYLPGHADEVSLIHEDIHNEETLDTEPLDSNEKNIQEMPTSKELLDFIAEENAQLRKIKLLDLDVAKAQLQLKQKEIQVKLAALNPVENVTHHSNLTTHDIEAFGVIVRGVIYIDSHYQAILQLNNNIVTVKSGDLINGGYKVVDIKSNQVVLNDAQGLEKIILVGG